MTRPSDFLAVLENPESGPLVVKDEEGSLILQLIVHIFFADSHLDEREIELMCKMLGHESHDELRDRFAALAKKGMDFDKLAATFPDLQDRNDIITIAEHAWWADNLLEPEEMDVADKLAEIFDIHER